MNIEQAKQLKAGDYIHTPDRFNSDGTPMRARVTSVKTWKTRPDHVRIRAKHGLYDYAEFDQDELNLIEPGYGS